MIANPERFDLMFLSPNKQNLINQQSVDIRGISLKSETKFTLSGIDIDNRLTFHSHINNRCRKAANQINALKRLSVEFTWERMKKWSLYNLSYCQILITAYLFGTSVVKLILTG